jgi:hypothetical protein
VLGVYLKVSGGTRSSAVDTHSTIYHIHSPVRCRDSCTFGENIRHNTIICKSILDSYDRYRTRRLFNFVVGGNINDERCIKGRGGSVSISSVTTSSKGGTELNGGNEGGEDNGSKIHGRVRSVGSRLVRREIYTRGKEAVSKLSTGIVAGRQLRKIEQGNAKQSRAEPTSSVVTKQATSRQQPTMIK